LAKNVQKKASKTPTDDLVKPVSRQLEQNELDQVSAGVNFVKKMDKASPQ
jgi:hypothetical protein